MTGRRYFLNTRTNQITLDIATALSWWTDDGDEVEYRIMGGVLYETWPAIK